MLHAKSPEGGRELLPLQKEVELEGYTSLIFMPLLLEPPSPPLPCSTLAAFYREALKRLQLEDKMDTIERAAAERAVGETRPATGAGVEPSAAK